MAALSTESEEPIVYACISNIPKQFNSKEVRDYFSQFLEGGGFQCFHFIHRPERTIAENKGSNSTRPSNVTSTTSNDVTPMEGARSTFDEARQEAFPRQNIRDVKTKKNKNKKGSALNTNNVHAPTSCGVVSLSESNFEKLTKMYLNQNWTDSEGAMAQLCHIYKIKVVEDNDKGLQNPLHQALSKKAKQKLKPVVISETMLRSDIQNLRELRPPHVMPRGNVGTPTPVFSQLITECRLPPGVIKKLGIVFPKSRSNRRYGNVQLAYGEEVYVAVAKEGAEGTADEGSSQSQKKKKKKKRKMRRRDHYEAKKQRMNLDLDNSINNTHQSIPPSKSDKPFPSPLPSSSHPKSTSNPSSPREDDDSGEEWDRHEALHNDVTNQERTTERLFEGPMEVTWDKGSSGLVFYTDAAFWDKQEGDFDEKTADDWDVDMSGYHDPDGGDKDARDFIQMREQQRRLDGIEIISAFSPEKKVGRLMREDRDRRRRTRMRDETEKRIAKDLARPFGQFEKHTKGFGRKFMEAKGWKEGEGLGKDGNKGIYSALHNEGQNNFDKSGIGYYGRQLSPTRTSSNVGFKRPKKGKKVVLISTIYDDPEVTDPVERLLRSQGPNSLKYRNNVNFTKAADTGLKRLHSL